MSLIKYSPFANLDRFFDDSILTPFRKFGWDMAVDVYEEKDKVIVKMTVPAMKAEDFEISVDEDILSVSGERAEEHEVDEKEYYSKEIRRGSFSRLVELPCHVDGSKAEADYKDGVLKIVLPKLADEEKKGVKINVKK